MRVGSIRWALGTVTVDGHSGMDVWWGVWGPQGGKEHKETPEMFVCFGGTGV
jgi:hypothetical protein